MPSHPLGNYHITKKGYARLHSGKYKGQYLHRALFREVAGRDIRDGFHIHHQTFNKLCFCPHNLIEIDPLLHPAQEPPRCPFTGRFYQKWELERMNWRNKQQSSIA